MVAPRTDDAPVERLAILVVYFVPDERDLPLVALHLDRIEQHTKVPYSVYAAANRATPSTLTMLSSRADVELCEIPPTELRHSQEHAYYLDALARQAIADGATHLVTLDCDSFPIRDDWVGVLEAAAPPESGLAALVRSEQFDEMLPHPACIFATTAFFERFEPSFAPYGDGSSVYRRFLRTTRQRADTGIQFAYLPWRAERPWGHLLRSNATDLHPVIAGIYGGVVFHLGGGSREFLLFREELASSPVHRMTRPIERIPVWGTAMKRSKTRLLWQLRGRTEREMSKRNRAAYSVAREWLLTDSDGLLAFLQGNPAGPSGRALLEQLESPPVVHDPAFRAT